MNEKVTLLHVVKMLLVFSLVGLLASCGGGSSSTGEGGKGSVNVISPDLDVSIVDNVSTISTLTGESKLQAGRAQPVISEGVQPVAAEDEDGNILLLDFVVSSGDVISLGVESTARSLVQMSPVLMFRTPEQRAALVAGINPDMPEFVSLMKTINNYLLAGSLWSEDEQVYLLAAQVANALLTVSASPAASRLVHKPALAKVRVDTISEQGNPPYIVIDNEKTIDIRNPNLHYYAMDVIDAQRRIPRIPRIPGTVYLLI